MGAGVVISVNTEPMTLALRQGGRACALLRLTLRAATVAGFAALGWFVAAWFSATAFAAPADADAESRGEPKGLVSVVGSATSVTASAVDGVSTTLQTAATTVDATLDDTLDDTVSVVSEVAETGVDSVTKTVGTVTGTVDNVVSTVTGTVGDVADSLHGQGAPAVPAPEPDLAPAAPREASAAAPVSPVPGVTDEAAATEESTPDVGGPQYSEPAGPAVPGTSGPALRYAGPIDAGHQAPIEHPQSLTSASLPGTVVSPPSGQDAAGKHAVLGSADQVADRRLAGTAVRASFLGAGKDAALPCTSPD